MAANAGLGGSLIDSLLPHPWWNTETCKTKNDATVNVCQRPLFIALAFIWKIGTQVILFIIGCAVM
jgi:hypothetical protein